MSSPAIRQVDHVNVLSDDPARTASLLADALALPVSAPLLRCPTFELEILTAGNVTLESIRHRGGPGSGRGISLTGVVFEPDSTAAQAAAELRERPAYAFRGLRAIPSLRRRAQLAGLPRRRRAR
jgi:hypothetical protein